MLPASLPTMAVFAYRALNDQAAAVEGTIAADTARDALRLRGLIVESVTTTGAGENTAKMTSVKMG